MSPFILTVLVWIILNPGPMFGIVAIAMGLMFIGAFFFLTRNVPHLGGVQK